MHLAYWIGLVLPWFVTGWYPGYQVLDEELGLWTFQSPVVVEGAGWLALAGGFYLSLVSNMALRRRGDGANAFLLTKVVVHVDIYQQTRNPMSLGYYLLCLSAAVLLSSTFLLLAALLGVIPVHIFYLKFFEERELALRFGASYETYRAQVPFLIPRILSK